MTIIVPVAITPAGLPLPDPGDRATFSARKLEQLRWANNEYATGSKALADASYYNALDSQASASRAQIDAASSAQNAVLAATHAGATMWAPGTYALGAVVSSPSTGWLFRKKTASSATSVDPINDPANWASVSSVAPKQVITAAVTQAVAGGAYALTNSTPQAAATNLIRFSNAIDNAAWDRIGTANVIANTDWDYAGNLQAVSLALPTLGDRLYSPTISVSASTAYAVSIWLRGSGVIYLAGVVSGGAGMNFASPITLTSTLTRYSVTLTTPAGATSLFVMIGTFNPSTGPAGTATGAYVSGVQVETGSVATSNIPTTSAPVTRPAGVIAPQRIILPASPNSNEAISVMAANGSAENIIDPNGQQFYGPSGPLAGPLKLDSKNASVDLQFINGYWRSI